MNKLTFTRSCCKLYQSYYEIEALKLYLHKKKLIQMTVLFMQDLKPLATAEDIANQQCDALTGEWSNVKSLDKPKRELPVIQEILKL